ncbi:hypothetical protein M422DRAFT_250251 [Sphaerobolus stellatus SS14]|uniref:Uncharacterized protein n=1 Tax=Sphaerobolus stellatus (strain SS14) TaxID=990650 RepID=A0A0C9UTP0_SPHS4|nr:hypothetical protein M422DRAFT_250251 [Sphaerobolus stellatus SS14]
MAVFSVNSKPTSRPPRGRGSYSSSLSPSWKTGTSLCSLPIANSRLPTRSTDMLPSSPSPASSLPVCRWLNAILDRLSRYKRGHVNRRMSPHEEASKGVRTYDSQIYFPFNIMQSILDDTYTLKLVFLFLDPSPPILLPLQHRPRHAHRLLDIDNVEESGISLSAQLAAYVATLSLERRFNHGEPNGREAVLVLAWTKMVSTTLRRSVDAKMRGSERKTAAVEAGMEHADVGPVHEGGKSTTSLENEINVEILLVKSTLPESGKKVRMPHTSSLLRFGHAASSSIGNVLRIIGPSGKPLHVLTCEPNSPSFPVTTPTSLTHTSSDTVRVDYGASKRDTIRG